jgi:hypothetical protein
LPHRLLAVSRHSAAEHLTALQRVSLNDHYQDERVLQVLTSGSATALWNGFRLVDAD